MAYKIGDVVLLKSGGPKMVVTFVADANKYFCEWFPPTGNGGWDAPKQGTFPFEALQLATADRK